MKFHLFLFVTILARLSFAEETDLEESESNQSYGYGYGTKVSDQYGESTVYVHGFGTTNDDDRYNEIQDAIVPAYEQPIYAPPPPPPPPVYQAKPYIPAPYYRKPALSGYGYGQIDAYGNARHGYGFNRYGYDSPVYAGYAPAPYHPTPLGVPPTFPPHVTPLPEGPLDIPVSPAVVPAPVAPTPVPVPAGPVISHSLPPAPTPVYNPAPEPIHSSSLSHSFGYGFSQF